MEVFRMATSLLQIRIDDELKVEAAQIFEQLGIDIPTAVRIFLKRSVAENGIPFSMTLPKTEYRADKALRAMKEIGESAKKNELSDMSLEEINEEIKAVRYKNEPKGGEV